MSHDSRGNHSAVLRGWCVMVRDDHSGLYESVAAAATRGQAIAACYGAAREAGYRWKWGDFRAHRKASADLWAAAHTKPTIVSTRHFNEHCT